MIIVNGLCSYAVGTVSCITMTLCASINAAVVKAICLCATLGSRVVTALMIGITGLMIGIRTAVISVQYC